MATRVEFWGVEELGLGEDSGASLSVPFKSLALGQKMYWRKSGVIPLGYTSISSIQLRFIRKGTGNLYIKFACSHTAQATGSAPSEDVDSYTTYTETSADSSMGNLTVPSTAYNGLTGMAAGDTLSLTVYRDDSGATDTYTTDFDVAGFLITFSTGVDVEASTGDRSKRILGKVLLTIGSPLGKMARTDYNIPEAAIYSIMGDYATKIAEDLLCLETSTTLTVTSSAGSEPTGFISLKLIELGTDLYIQPKEIDLIDYDLIVRNNYYSDPIQTPLYYKRWNGTITFHPTVDSDSYTIYYYTRPTTTPSSSADPETPSNYDKIIEYGTISEVAAMVGRSDLINIYSVKYQQEMDNALGNLARARTVTEGIKPYGYNKYIKPILEH